MVALPHTTALVIAQKNWGTVCHREHPENPMSLCTMEVQERTMELLYSHLNCELKNLPQKMLKKYYYGFFTFVLFSTVLTVTCHSLLG